MKRKKYLKPTMDIVELSDMEVVATSSGTGGSRSSYTGQDEQNWGDPGSSNAKSRGNDIWNE